MFTRTVTSITKPGKGKEVCTTIREKVIPLLRNQSGFIDEITLVSTSNPNHIVAHSFWKTREDAERYYQSNYQTVLGLLRHHLDSEPTVETFDLEHSTVHKIAAGKAA
ncbi:MAG TPA: antibiotic biosynthesis monooxygenase [Terriglobales bacterium]|nr:antibiotic biosynthesis monooxygenase [Terriglobales bacterium]